MWPNLYDTWPFGRPVGQTCIGLALGAAVVLVAVVTQIPGDGWRLSVSFAASAISGALLLAGAISHYWTRAAGAAAGQLATAFAWALPIASVTDGLVLIWPLFAVPAGVVLVLGIGLVGRDLMHRRGR